MATSRGNLERTTGSLLSFQVRHIKRRGLIGLNMRTGRAENLRAAKMVEQRRQIIWCNHVNRASPGGLTATGRWTDQPAVTCRGGKGSRQDTRHRLQGTIQRQLTENQAILDAILGQHTHRHEQRHRDWQIKMCAFLQDIGR